MSFITKPLQDFAAWVSHPNKKRCFNLKEGSAKDVDLFGYKGAALCELRRLDLAVPSAFIISSEYALEMKDNLAPGDSPPDEFIKELDMRIRDLERKTGKEFGPKTSGKFPLLLSVRGSSAISLPSWNTMNLTGPSRYEWQSLPDSYSIPGVMDTVLNVGINDDIAMQLSQEIGPRFAYDTYARFLMSYGITVMGEDPKMYLDIIRALVDRNKSTKVMGSRGILLISDLLDMVTAFKKLHKAPQNPVEQLMNVINAIHKTWFSEKATRLRDGMNLSPCVGTAIIVQSMVLGNISQHSGTGVCFSRDPNTGITGVVGQFLANAEGDDAVTNEMRTPMSFDSLDMLMPNVTKKLREYCEILEIQHREVQEIEFAVQDSNLYVLNAKSARRSPVASVRTAISMMQSGHLTERETLMKLDPRQMGYFLEQQVDPTVQRKSLNIIAKGFPAGYGVSCGKVAFTSALAVDLAQKGESIVYCIDHSELNKDDIFAIRNSCVAVVALSGNMHSEVATLCRGLGKPCITNCRELSFVTKNELETYAQEEKTASANAGRIKTLQGLPTQKYLYGSTYGPDSKVVIICEQELVTVNGSSGELIAGSPVTVDASEDVNWQALVQLTDKFRKLKCFATINGPKDVLKAIENEIDGVGCLYTDYIIKSSDAVVRLLRTFFLSSNSEEKGRILDQVELYLKNELKKIFAAFDDKEIVVKLFDTMLQDILPHTEADQIALAAAGNYPVMHVKRKFNALRDENPAIGLRGCRLFMLYPELMVTQVKAIVKATVELMEEGINVFPGITIPFVSSYQELEVLLPILHKAIDNVHNCSPPSDKHCKMFSIGAIISTPRGCMRTDAIAPLVSYICYDTTDLTELSFGCSKNDSAKFTMQYLKSIAHSFDPFQQFDDNGVGKLLEMAVINAKKTNKSLTQCVISDNHGCDYRSAEFFQKLGINVIVCKPNKVPLAKLIAAQTNIKLVSNNADFFAANPSFFTSDYPTASWIDIF